MSTKVLPIITIDGPAGVGKTTLAAALAEKLGLPCLDTGAMFRTLALCAQDLADPDDLRPCLEHLDFSLAGSGATTRLVCNDKIVGEEIRNEKIGEMASKLATRPEVRQFMLEAQRKTGTSTPLVTEGRDMGSVVFPEAAFKFFLDAASAVRAQRRYNQYLQRGEKVNLQDLERQIILRDEQDRNRASAPLKPAPDAIIIDTGNLSASQVLELILSHIPPNFFPHTAN